MTYRNLFFLLLAAGVVTQSCSSSKHTTAGQAVESHVVYEPGGIYTSMRIPALVITKQNTLLAFCEARIGSASDWAGMHLALRRSTDDGKTWSGITVIDSSREYPAGNPVPETILKGTGKVMVFHGGKVLIGTWSKKDADSPIMLKARDGSEIKVPAGKVYTELVPSDKDGGRVTFSKR